MKRVLFDVHIVLDVLLDRKPHVEVSALLWGAAETGAVRAFVAAHAVTTIHYLVRKERGAARAREIVFAILSVFEVAAVDAPVLQEALRLPGPNFEDSVTAAAARGAKCDYIITRDPRGFPSSPVPCLTPEAALPLLGSR